MIKLLQKIMPFLNESVPEDMALKAIGKVSPKIHTFLNNGISRGLTLASGLAFLRSQLDGKKEKNIDPTLRPDEQASQKYIAREKSFSELPGKALDVGLGLASAGLGTSTLAKLGSQIASNIGSQQTPKTAPVFSIRETNPILAEEIETTMERGYDPLQTAAIISNSSRFNKEIRDIQRKTNRKIEDLITEEFQGKKAAFNKAPQGGNSNWDQLMQRLETLLAK